MSADSICKIVQYVRQNAHEKPELWPFVRKEDKKRYFDLDGGVQQTSSECQLVMYSATKTDLQLIVTNGWIDNFSSSTIQIFNGDEPDSIALSIAANKSSKSAVFEAFNPQFELPKDYASIIDETLIEVQCPLYVPTPDNGDGYEKYRAVNIDYLEKHQKTNYVTRIATDYEQAAIKLKQYNAENIIDIKSDTHKTVINTNNLIMQSSTDRLSLYPTDIILDKTSGGVNFHATVNKLNIGNSSVYSVLTDKSLSIYDTVKQMAILKPLDLTVRMMTAIQEQL